MKKNNKNRKQIRRKRTKKSRKSSVTQVPTVKDFDSLTDLQLFSMIGANYLSSDYESGEWKPIFDKISPPLSLDEQQAHIVIQAYSEQSEQIDPQYLLPCSWVMLPSPMKKTLFDQLVSNFGVGFLSGEINTEVWDFFHNFKQLLDGYIKANQELEESQ